MFIKVLLITCALFSKADYLIGGKALVTKKEIKKAKKEYKAIGLNDNDIKKRIIEIKKLAFILKNAGIIAAPQFLKEKVRKEELTQYELDEILLENFFKSFKDSTPVTQEEIETRKKEYVSKSNEPLYRLREIFLSFKSNDVQEEQEVLNQIRKFRELVLEQGSEKFSELASKFSQRNSKFSKGLIGNLRESQIPLVVKLELQKLSDSPITDVVREEEGYSFFVLEGIYPKGFIPSDDDIKEEILSEKLNSKIKFVKENNPAIIKNI
jgi:hypothetical protein